jgi:cytochrome c oxidase subunit 2
LILSIVVVLIVTGLVAAGIWRKRTDYPLGTGAAVPVARTGNGLRWIYVGVGLSFVALVATLFWTMVTIADIAGPPAAPAVRLKVTAQQWWWKVQYLNSDVSRILTTANEIHIPTGKPIQIELTSTDVIHSFWIPALSGKTDAIPGQTNIQWLEASRPGVYRGQCTEYCGMQHAHMGMFVIAQKPSQFQSWLNQQLAPAPVPTTAQTARGEQLFVYRCGTCHTARGSDAAGMVAPDLTHLMSRSTIAAGTLPTTIATLSGWVANPQAVKPGNHMPVLYLLGPELNDLRAYLKTLK